MDVELFRFVLVAVLAIACLLCCQNWKVAVFGLVCWDAFRDPLRKTLPTEQILLSIAGLLLWVFTLAGCLRDQSSAPRAMNFLVIPVTGLLIFVVVSTAAGILQGVPFPVTLLGWVSYLFPLVGLPIGLRLANDVRRISELLTFYCVINVLLVSTAILEVAKFQSPVLGGIMMEWHRVTGSTSIPLPSGTYRSPDILGLHAAHILAFSAILWRLHGQYSKARVIIAVILIISAPLLIYTARRKMIGLVVVFLIVDLALRFAVRETSFSNSFRALLRKSRTPVLIVIAIGILAARLISPGHVQYALTVFSEAPSRLVSSVIDSPVTTVQQTGFWGTGIGTATQGNYALAAGFSGGWQEDGVSRLVREGGILGALALVSGAFIFLWHGTRVRFLATMEKGSRYSTLHTGLWSIAIANFFCLLISHQHLSGDPQFGALLALITGLSFGSYGESN